MARLRSPFSAAPSRAARLQVLLWVGCLLAPLPSAASQGDARESLLPPRATAEPPARAGKTAANWADFDRVLLDRYAMGPDGRRALDQLLRTFVVADIAGERSLVIDDRDVDRRWQELDRKLRAEGQAEGLEGQLSSNRIARAYFREMLRVALLQEELTREELNLPKGKPVSGDDQEIWLGQEMARRGLEAPPPPWDGGFVARCGATVVTVEEYTRVLRHQLPLDELRETCFQLLLELRARQRVGDVPAEQLERSLDLEFERRRAEAEADPRYQGVAYGALLEAKGLSLEGMRRDPSVRIASLAQVWVDHAHGEDGLRATYEAERGYFDGLYGEAVRGRALVLRAARFKNDMNPRTFEEADAILQRLGAQATSEATMAELVRVHAEDPKDRAGGGDSGWITRLDERVPAPLREALFDALVPGGEVPAGGVLLGPLHTSAHSVLFWLSQSRPTPDWGTMSQHVHRELRKRFLDELLAREDVRTYLD